MTFDKSRVVSKNAVSFADRVLGFSKALVVGSRWPRNAIYREMIAMDDADSLQA